MVYKPSIKYFTILLLFVNFIIYAQTLDYQNDRNLRSLGLGLLQKVKISEKLKFYLDSNFKTPFNDNEVKKIIPILYKPDYGICFFVCVKASKKYYIVKSGDNTFFVKPMETLIYYSWESFLCEQVINLKSKNPTLNPPRYSINGKIINASDWKSDDEQDILEVRNEFVKIKNETRKVVYWLKWRNGNSLTVFLNMLI